VTDPRLTHRIEEVLEVEMADDVLAWEAAPDGSWTKVPTETGVDTHQRLLNLAADRARGEVPYPS
jgi:polyphosphate kinase